MRTLHTPQRPAKPRPQRVGSGTVKTAWLPLLLPLAMMLATLCILWQGPGLLSRSELFRSPSTGVSGAVDSLGQPGLLASSTVSLFDEALGASSLLAPEDLLALGEAGAWLALPAGPMLARWLEPELRIMLGLRGKLNAGGPFVLQGQLLRQQAESAAEALLNRDPHTERASGAKG